MRIRTANNKARRAQKRTVYSEAKAFHERRVARLFASGRIDKLQNSGYIQRSKQKEWLFAVNWDDPAALSGLYPHHRANRDA